MTQEELLQLISAGTFARLVTFLVIFHQNVHLSLPSSHPLPALSPSLTSCQMWNQRERKGGRERRREGVGGRGRERRGMERERERKGGREREREAALLSLPHPLISLSNHNAVHF